MQRPETRRKYLRMVVILTAVTIVFSQFLCFQTFGQPKPEVEAAQQENDHEENLVYLSLPSGSLPSSTHVGFNQTMFFLFDITFKERESDERNFCDLLPLNRFFKTLSDGVITPNAP